MLVKNIKFKNNKVEVILDEGSFFISKENYIENPIAIDSNITQKKIDSLLKKEKTIQAKMDLIKLLSRKILTKKEAYKYLCDKEIEFKERESLIKDIEKIGLINDEYACEVMMNSLLNKRKGKIQIREILKEKGINEDIINQNIGQINNEEYKSNFQKVCEKYLKMYSNKSSKVKETMIKAKLKEYGYENELIDGVLLESNKDEDIELARKHLAKLLRNKKIDIKDHQNINKIKAKLVMKGFNYDIINLVLREVNCDETY